MSKKKKILITGGCGFIGTNLITYILNKNYKIVNLDKIYTYSNTKYKFNKKVEFIKMI